MTTGCGLYRALAPAGAVESTLPPKDPNVLPSQTARQPKFGAEITVRTHPNRGVRPWCGGGVDSTAHHPSASRSWLTWMSMDRPRRRLRVRPSDLISRRMANSQNEWETRRKARLQWNIRGHQRNARDRREIGGQAAIAIGGHGSLAGWNFCERGAWIRGAGALTLPASRVRRRGRSLGVPGPACG